MAWGRTVVYFLWPAVLAAGGPGTNESAAGLQKAVFQVPEGKITACFPADTRAGDTISGIVRAEPSGDSEKKQRRNQDRLDGLVVEVERQTSPVSTPWARWTVPPAAAAALTVLLRDRYGREVGRTVIPLQPNPRHEHATIPGAIEDVSDAVVNPESTWTRPAAVAADDFRLPTTGQTGRPVTCYGPFDGDLGTTAVTAGGRPARLLAESPRTLTLESPLDVTGTTTLALTERGVECSGAYRNVDVRLTAPTTHLQKGETTTLSIRVLGLEGLEEDVPLELEKAGVVSMSGGDRQVITIRPSEVGTGGSCAYERTLTALAAGTFSVVASVWAPRATLHGVKSAGGGEGKRPESEPTRAGQEPPAPTGAEPPARPRVPALATTIEGDVCTPSSEWKAGPGISISRNLDYYPKRPSYRPGDLIAFRVEAQDYDVLVQRCACAHGEDLRVQREQVRDRVTYEWTVGGSMTWPLLAAPRPEDGSIVVQIPHCLQGRQSLSVGVAVRSDGKAADDPVSGSLTFEVVQLPPAILVTLKTSSLIPSGPGVKPEDKPGACCKVEPLQWAAGAALDGGGPPSVSISMVPAVPEVGASFDAVADNFLVLLRAGGSDTDSAILSCTPGGCGCGPASGALDAEEALLYAWAASPADGGSFPLGDVGPSVVFLPAQGTGAVTVSCTVMDSHTQFDDGAKTVSTEVPRPPLKPRAYVIVGDCEGLVWGYVEKAYEEAMEDYREAGYEAILLKGDAAAAADASMSQGEGATRAQVKAAVLDPYMRALTILSHGSAGSVDLARGDFLDADRLLQWTRERWGSGCAQHPYLRRLVLHACEAGQGTWQDVISGSVEADYQDKTTVIGWWQWEEWHDPPDAQW